MTQKRLIDFGSTLEASKFKDAWRRMFAPSILEGYDISIATSMIPVATVEFSPGAAIVPNGTIITDDSSIPVEVPLGAPAFESTIVYEHMDQKIIGGSAAQLITVSGIMDTWPDSVVMAWISYPGGSVPLSLDHIIPAPKAKINPLSIPVSVETDILTPPFAEFFLLSTGTNVTAETIYDGSAEQLFYQVSSTTFATGTETAEIIMQLPVNRLTAPQFMSFEFDAPTTDSLTVEILDTIGTTISGTPITFPGTGSSTTEVVEIDGGTFTEGSLYLVKLTIEVDVASVAQLSRIDISYRQLPF